MSAGKKDIPLENNDQELKNKGRRELEAGYEADRSTESSPHRTSKDSPVCNGCGRIFCFGGFRCENTEKRGDGTPGFRSWEGKKKGKDGVKKGS